VDAQAGLWAAVLASGVYHGLNPGMGWPLAVAAGLTERRGIAVVWTLAPLAAGHLVSIAVVLLPFAALTLVLDWNREIRIGAGLGIIAFAVLLLMSPRHPRWMTHIRPRQVALWSFAVALLHGAGLMLVPMLLGLCAPTSLAQPFNGPDLFGNAGLVVAISAVHTGALVVAGGLLAFLTYRIVGLGMLSRSWFDLGRVWAGTMALAGALGLWSALL
jgi:hypothetical protein